MHTFLVIDPIAAVRDQLAKHIGLLQSDHPLETYSRISEILDIHSSILKSKAIIFISATLGTEEVCKFTRSIHEKDPATCIIATLTNPDFEIVKALIHSGIDQILTLPCSASQLQTKVDQAKHFRAQVMKDGAGTVPKEFEAFFLSHPKNTYTLSLKGFLDENSNLPDINALGHSNTLIVNAENLRGLNSVGIRIWIVYFKMIQVNFNEIFFENVAPALLKQASLIENFFPEKSKIRSFYLLYYNDDLDIEKTVKFEHGEHYDHSLMSIPRTVNLKIDDQSIAFTLDENVNKVLKFYKGQIAVIG